jgi:hypothetical protein
MIFAIVMTLVHLISCNEINIFISLCEIPFFFFLFEISVFHRHLYNHNKVHVVILISQSQKGIQ